MVPSNIEPTYQVRVIAAHCDLIHMITLRSRHIGRLGDQRQRWMGNHVAYHFRPSIVPLIEKEEGKKHVQKKQQRREYDPHMIALWCKERHT